MLDKIVLLYTDWKVQRPFLKENIAGIHFKPGHYGM